MSFGWYIDNPLSNIAVPSAASGTVAVATVAGPPEGVPGSGAGRGGVPGPGLYRAAAAAVTTKSRTSAPTPDLKTGRRSVTWLCTACPATTHAPPCGPRVTVVIHPRANAIDRYSVSVAPSGALRSSADRWR